MRILFFGLGSIGKRHARLLQKTTDHELFAFRTNKGQERNDLGINEIARKAQIDDIKPDIAFITNPTYLHVPTAHYCAKKGLHLFIEKPISHSLEGLDALSRTVNEKHLVAYVGLNLRFHPTLAALKKALGTKRVLYSNTVVTSYLPNWRKDQDYRRSYSAHKDKGGGILLDLFHELDYNDWLFGQILEIGGRYGQIGGLDINAEDYADMVLRFKHGGIGTIHMNWFSHHEQRKIQVFCPGRSFHADLINNKLSEYKEGKLEKEISSPVDRDYTYAQQMKMFLDAVERKDTSVNNIAGSIRLLKILMKFKTISRNKMGARK